MAELTGGVIALILISICFGANFYLLSQWLVYPKLRRRFQVCRPYLRIGGVLYFVGGAVIRQIWRAQQSYTLTQIGNLVALIGLGLTVFAAIRLLRANAAERRAGKTAQVTLSTGGIWPPPPNLPLP